MITLQGAPTCSAKSDGYGYDANSDQTGYTYDARNRRLTRTDALGKADSYAYDANSNLTQHTDRDGNVAAYTHDGLDRRIQASFSVPGKGGKLTLQDTINYAWDGGDRLTQAVDSTAGTISRTYDGLDDLLSETTP